MFAREAGLFHSFLKVFVVGLRKKELALEKLFNFELAQEDFTLR